MDDYCSNTVTFTGENSNNVLDHFRNFSKKVPPFLNTVVSGNSVTFESRWTPPIRDLNAIAERFDVSYHLQYRINEKPKETLSYICLNHEPMSPAAERIRIVINGLSTEDDIKNAEKMVGELLTHRTLNLHDLGVIACVFNKRAEAVERIPDIDKEILDEINRKPWESEDHPTDRNRQR